MSLIKWNNIDQFDNFFEDFPFMTQSSTKKCAVDMYEEKGNLIVDASLPGFDKKDIDVVVENGYLTISAEYKEESEKKDKYYYSKEIRNGSFSRVIRLPDNVEDDEVDAGFKDGILKITIPHKEKIKELPARKIEIK